MRNEKYKEKNDSRKVISAIADYDALGGGETMVG